MGKYSEAVENKRNLYKLLVGFNLYLQSIDGTYKFCVILYIIIVFETFRAIYRKRQCQSF